MKPSAILRAATTAITHPPKIIHCELCDGRRLQIRTGPGSRIGWRCLGCRGTGHHRATFAAIREIFGPHLEGLRGGSVYELSCHGALHTILKRRAVSRDYSFTDSEFFPGIKSGTIHKGVRCEDVENLSFPSDSFDLITSTGLMEHVEHDERGFAEIARVLKPGGYNIFTVPVSVRRPTQVRAIRRNGHIENLLPPEYHSDPWHVQGVFTWRNYGFDIVDTMRRAGLLAEIRSVALSGIDTKMPIIVARRPE